MLCCLSRNYFCAELAACLGLVGKCAGPRVFREGKGKKTLRFSPGAPQHKRLICWGEPDGLGLPCTNSGCLAVNEDPEITSP